MKRSLSTGLVLAFLAVACGGNYEPEPIPVVPARTPGKDIFYKGTTMSFASYMQAIGLKYREGGKETDPYVSVANHGANCVRLQLDQVPFEIYNGVTIDWQTWNRVLADAKKAKAQGLEIVLTLKPDRDIFDSNGTNHNNIPSDWSSLNDAQVGQKLHDWVYGRLAALAEEGIYPAIVAVGNEVNLGFLKNRNVVDNTRTGRLLAYGFQAVREYAEAYNPACLSALHVADPAKAVSGVKMIEDAGAKDYDVVAISYYPGSDIGHGLPGGSFASLAKSFSKPLMVMETAYTFTTGTVDGKWKGDNCNNAYNYPDWNEARNFVNYTPAKARAWLGDLARDVKAGGGLGLITWGTESLPDNIATSAHGKGLYTYPASWAHGSTWENNSYWDFTDSNNLHEGIDWMKDIQ